ncbi:prepilin peptidase-dependent protein D [Vibrio zhanjiangensis]|uniref:Prepilin peptidase-dependent protein D n=2 Tax=Vibrio zhanjiangensis TaxID=1046128 RepID=A0ABQ6F4J6_9VIBR|nr:prepilin peptidase-dependent protein D [Vibrio zhanjiangensis]
MSVCFHIIDSNFLHKQLMVLATMKTSLGFTLIELMIVVAIIGILSSFAVPTYQNYTKRAHASEILSTMSAMKMAVGICASTTGEAQQCTSGKNGVPLKQDFSGYSIEALAVGGENIIKATATNAKGSLPADATLSLTSNVSISGLAWRLECTGIDSQHWCPES